MLQRLHIAKDLVDLTQPAIMDFNKIGNSHNMNLRNGDVEDTNGGVSKGKFPR